MKRFAVLALLVAVTTLSTEAQAQIFYSGTVSGRIVFWQNQGGFCPAAGRDCTGSNFLQPTPGNQWEGVAEIKLVVKSNTGQVIGNGSTDINGNYHITWQHNLNTLNATLDVLMEHRDGRFQVQDWNGVRYTYLVAVMNLIPTSDYNNGITYWGSSSVPDPVLNIYNGAFRTWYNSFSNSGLLISQFTNVKIRFNSGVCLTSCANGPAKRVDLDTGAGTPYVPQSRIMHELGHIASYLADLHGYVNGQGINCTPPITVDPPGGCFWGFNTQQWGFTAFEEGLATFLGDVALYNYTALVPHTCPGSPNLACPANMFNIETSLGSDGNVSSSSTVCGGAPGFSPLNTVRYFWDLFDDNQDTATSNAGVCAPVQTVHTDVIGRDIWEIIETLDNYVVGFGDRQNNDQFSSAGIYDERDNGRNLFDFKWNREFRGVPDNLNTTQLTCMNCAF